MTAFALIMTAEAVEVPAAITSLILHLLPEYLSFFTRTHEEATQTHMDIEEHVNVKGVAVRSEPLNGIEMV